VTASTSVIQFVALVLLLSSCAKQQVLVSDPGNQPSRATNVLMDSINESSQLSGIYRSGRVSYQYQSISMVHSTSGDSVPRTDSTRVAATLSVLFLEATANGLVKAITQAESIQVSLVNTPLSPSSAVQLLESQHDTLNIDRRTGRVLINHRQSTCAQSGPEPLFRGDELIPAISLRAPVTRSWADTSTQEFCRGGVHMNLTRVARYRFEEEAPASQAGDIRLIRIAETQLKGTGFQWQQTVEATGHGVSIDTLIIPRGTQRLARIVGRMQAEIEFRSTFRTQRFIQTVRSEITARE